MVLYKYLQQLRGVRFNYQYIVVAQDLVKFPTREMEIFNFFQTLISSRAIHSRAAELPAKFHWFAR